jgi:hypothetical protein
MHGAVELADSARVDGARDLIEGEHDGRLDRTFDAGSD